jgi:hypothetical protein
MTLPVPQDFVCEGTAWAEKRRPADPQNDDATPAVTQAGDGRGQDW